MESSFASKLVPFLQVLVPFLVVFLLGVFLLSQGEPERVYSQSTKNPKKHPLVIKPGAGGRADRQLQGRSWWYLLRLSLWRKYGRYPFVRRFFYIGP